MKTTLKTLLGLVLLTLGLPLLALAQDAGAGPEPGGGANMLLDAAVVIGPLMILGAILKNAFPAFPNRFIPLITLVLAVPLYIAKSGGQWGDMNVWVTAFLVGLSATGAHSGLKNTFQGDGEGGSVAGKVGLWFLLLCSLPLFCGCNVLPKAVVTVDSVVDGAMKEWARAQRDGRTTPELDAAVRKHHADYNVAKAKAAVLWETYMATGETQSATAALALLKEAVTPILDALWPIMPVDVAASRGRLAKAASP